MEETPVEAEPEGDFQSVSQKMRDISQQFDLNSSQGTQTSISVQQNICAYVRYLDWLENLKQVQSGLIQSSKDSPTSESDSNDIEDVTTRIAALQEEFIKEKSSNAIQELVIRSAQLGYKYQQLLFPDQPEVEGQENQEEGGEGAEKPSSWAKKLCDKQRVLSSDILAHIKTCKALQEEIDQSKKDTRDVQAANVDLMKKLQSKESADKQVAEPSNAVRQEQEKLDDLISHVAMEKGILQGLIIGSGVNWAKDPDLKDIVIGLGQQLKLD
ncbi:centromere protein H-like [Lytechinus variegatus]|uniref:centromere protein H-like n=1 Tax=Lytechinus variegatus TaxID=7654 RepID=UPI001BB0DD6D|nr:centromere protein H-like [Lytechinus variegatus]